MHERVASSQKSTGKQAGTKSENTTLNPAAAPETATGEWTPTRVMNLQRIVGNSAVQRMMSGAKGRIQRDVKVKLNTSTAVSEVDKLEYIAPIFDVQVDTVMQTLKPLLFQNILFPQAYQAGHDGNPAIQQELIKIVDYAMKKSASPTVLSAAKGDAAGIAAQLHAIISPAITLPRLQLFPQFKLISALGNQAQEYIAFLRMASQKMVDYQNEGQRQKNTETGAVNDNRKEKLKAEAARLIQALQNAVTGGIPGVINQALADTQTFMQEFPETQHVWDLDFLAEYRDVENTVQTELAEDETLGNKFHHEGGTDDGVSIKDEYNSNLACTLYAILAVKPGWLGANTPKDLHRILRRTEALKNYDDDRIAAKVRYMAGFVPEKVADQDKKVGEFIQEKSGRNMEHPSFIVDSEGIAHTFAAVWKTDKYVKIDEKTPTNGTFEEYRTNKMLVIWKNP